MAGTAERRRTEASRIRERERTENRIWGAVNNPLGNTGGRVDEVPRIAASGTSTVTGEAPVPNVFPQIVIPTVEVSFTNVDGIIRLRRFIPNRGGTGNTLLPGTFRYTSHVLITGNADITAGIRRIEGDVPDGHLLFVRMRHGGSFLGKGLPGVSNGNIVLKSEQTVITRAGDTILFIFSSGDWFQISPALSQLSAVKSEVSGSLGSLNNVDPTVDAKIRSQGAFLVRSRMFDEAGIWQAVSVFNRNVPVMRILPPGNEIGSIGTDGFVDSGRYDLHARNISFPGGMSIKPVKDDANRDDLTITIGGRTQSLGELVASRAQTLGDLENVTIDGEGNVLLRDGTTWQNVAVLPEEVIDDLPAEKITSGTLSTDIIPIIPGDKLPVIPADKLPEIPIEKIPDIPLGKITGTGDVEIGLVNLNDTDIVDATVPSVLLYPGDKWTAGLITDQYVSDVSASKITGVLDVDRIPGIPAGRITSGILSTSRLPRIPASLISGVLEANHIGEIPASRVNSGVFSLARIPSIPLSKLTQIPGSLTFNLTDAQDVDISTETGNAILARAGRVWGERDTIGDDFISDISADKLSGGEIPVAVRYADVRPGDTGTSLGETGGAWKSGFIESLYLQAGDNPTFPGQNGRMWLEGNDIMIRTGGKTVNLSMIGSGGTTTPVDPNVHVYGSMNMKILPPLLLRDYKRTGSLLMTEIKNPNPGSELGAFVERTGGSYLAPTGLRAVRKRTGLAESVINIPSPGAYEASESLQIPNSFRTFAVSVTRANGVGNIYNVINADVESFTSSQYAGISAPNRITEEIRYSNGSYRLVTDNTARKIYIVENNASKVYSDYPSNMDNIVIGFSLGGFPLLIDYSGRWEIRNRDAEVLSAGHLGIDKIVGWSSGLIFTEDFKSYNLFQQETSVDTSGDDPRGTFDVGSGPIRLVPGFISDEFSRPGKFLLSGIAGSSDLESGSSFIERTGGTRQNPTGVTAVSMSSENTFMVSTTAVGIHTYRLIERFTFGPDGPRFEVQGITITTIGANGATTTRSSANADVRTGNNPAFASISSPSAFGSIDIANPSASYDDEYFFIASDMENKIYVVKGSEDEATSEFTYAASDFVNYPQGFTSVSISLIQARTLDETRVLVVDYSGAWKIYNAMTKELVSEGDFGIDKIVNAGNGTISTEDFKVYPYFTSVMQN